MDLSGAIQHLAGTNCFKTILAIASNEEGPIFQVAVSPPRERPIASFESPFFGPRRYVGGL